MFNVLLTFWIYYYFFYKQKKCKTLLTPPLNFVAVHIDIIVTIWTSLLMIESHGVDIFVYYHSLCDTSRILEIYNLPATLWNFDFIFWFYFLTQRLIFMQIKFTHVFQSQSNNIPSQPDLSEYKRNPPLA